MKRTFPSPLRFLLGILLGAALLLVPQRLLRGQMPVRSIEDRLREFGEAADARLLPHFEAAGVSYPPGRLTLIGLKKEKRLEVHAAGEDGVARFIRAYPILAASGRAGPKLREGDRQVPEGFYRIELLNPNSLFHASLRLDYPNSFDQARAVEEQRNEPGTDIMIHGGNASVGCLAVGDEAAEDLFTLAARTGIENAEVLLVPWDLRGEHAALPAPPDVPPWMSPLYAALKSALARFDAPSADPGAAGPSAETQVSSR